ncbi:MAG: hypothetical protein HOW73_24770 [Polyangiaceae bacterium]|nr:hypothetical protein [Polyangiaceae bacterium]
MKPTPARLAHVVPLAIVVAACSTGPSAKEPTAIGKASSSSAKASGPSQTADVHQVSCTPDARSPKASPALAERNKGVTAIAEGRTEDALKSLELALGQDPSDLAAFTLHVAANADVSEARVRAGRSFGKLKPQKVESARPPHKNFGKADKGPSVTLKRGPEERHTGDWYGWLAQHSLKNPIGFAGEMTLPSMFADTFGDQPMFGTYVHETHTVVRYGPSLVVLGQEGKGMRALQLEPLILDTFQLAGPTPPPTPIFPEVRYAEVVGSTLIVEVAHEGDGASIKPDGVLAGFDLEKDKLAWISDAKVSNAYSGYATGTHFITSFTDTTGGKLNVIDVATGDLVASEALPSRMDYIVGQGAKVYAWGYEKALTFDLSTAPALGAPKLGALVKDESSAKAVLDAGRRCLLQNAVIALDHRDGAALVKAAEQLPEEASITRAFGAAGEFLMARAQGRAGLDLTEKRPVPVEFVATALVAKDAKKPSTPPKRLVSVKDPTLDPPKPPFMEGPRPLYSVMRLDLFPNRYGVWNIEGAFAAGDRTIVNYGRQFIVTLKNDQVDNIVDLKPLLGEGAKDTALTPVYFAAVLDGILYAIVTPQSGPAGANNSYIAAIDPSTAKILWRTSNTIFPRPFIVFGDYLVAAQNREKNGELVLLRLSDGQQVGSVKTKEPVRDFGWDSRGTIYAGLATSRENFMLK